MPPRSTIYCLLACMATLSCRRESAENLGLGFAARRQVDVRALERVDELLLALEQEGPDLDEPLGPRQQVLSSTIQVEPKGRPPEVLHERFVADTDGQGGVRLVHDSGPKDGFEAIFFDGALYVRPRFGKFVHRRPEGDEVARLRRLVEGVPAASMELVAPFLTVREVGQGRQLGRTTRRLSLSLRSTGVPGKEGEPGRKWRETLKVETLDGELEVDAKTGAPLALRFDVRYRFDRPAGPSPVSVTSTLRLETGPPEPVPMPVDFVEMPHRSRPMMDRNFLLGGLSHP